MDFATGYGDATGFAQLFADTFTASEGAEEGVMLGSLVRDILETTPEGDVFTFTALDGEALVGGVCFTRLHYADDPRVVSLLSPMAVRPDRQGEGIGQALIRFALTHLKEAGVDVVLTYGDPAFYGRVGFTPITQEAIAAPYPLSMPQGWLGQSLTSEALISLAGEARCVPAFQRPEIW